VSYARRTSPVAGLWLLVLLVAACGGSGNSQPVGGDDAPGGGGDRVVLEKSNVTRYYSVYGDTTEAIFAYIRDHGPTDAAGRRGNGLTSVEWSYEWQRTSSRSSCSVASMRITIDLVVLLPRHEEQNSLSAPTATNWKRFVDGVTKHEQTHVDIYLSGADRLKGEMEAIGPKPTCDELEKAVTGAWDSEQTAINGAQDAFHAQEDARLNTARAPLQAQIDANRAKITSLSSQVEALDRTINDFRSQLDALQSQIDQVKADIAQIEKDFPDGIPLSVRTERYDPLVTQVNTLTTKYNAMVEPYNAALSQRASKATEYQNLVAETNGLVDTFNWTR
jgi:predicted secreted Zn-dependent protease/outer membrane murein-binding lipoprotein Lpp